MADHGLFERWRAAVLDHRPAALVTIVDGVGVGAKLLLVDGEAPLGTLGDADLDRWRRDGRRIAIARVVDIEGSGPRLPGAAMAVADDGEVAGSVSGGCVEGAVVTEALDVLATGDRRLVTFGYSDDEAFAVGLTCGGTVHLFIETLDW